MPHVDHPLTILAVRDLARARRFYEQAFGWTARVDVPVFVELVLPGGRGLGLYEQASFALNTREAPVLPPAGAISGTEIYLVTDDAVGVIAAALAAGARLLSPLALRGWGQDVGYVADPDGNVLAIAQGGRIEGINGPPA